MEKIKQSLDYPKYACLVFKLSSGYNITKAVKYRHLVALVIQAIVDMEGIIK